MEPLSGSNEQIETGPADTRDREQGRTLAEEMCSFLAPAQDADELGRLARYRILRILGAGGMGVVFEAEDPVLRRRLAIKVIRPSLAQSSAARERFLREARAVAAIESDHVVPLFDANIEHGIPYLAMPLLRGETLESRLQREGKLSAAEVVRIGREAAEGLAALHERGLVHRDVKPSNLWLEMERGRIKILDLGLATAIAPEERLTHFGTVVGTPQYMSPEQARGEALDARSDLFSLGCVLYRAATGAAPFQGATLVQTLRCLELETPSAPHQVVPEMLPGLSDLIMQLLAKDRAARPESARQVVDRLAALPEQASPPGTSEVRPVTPVAQPRSDTTLALPPLRRPRRAPIKLLLGLLSLLVLGTVVAGIWRSASRLPTTEPIPQEPVPEAPPPPEAPPQPGKEAARSPLSVRILNGHQAPVGPVAVAERDRHALSGAWDGKVLLWDLDSGKPVQSLGGHVGWAWAVAISADGREVLTAGKADKTVRLWTADGKKVLDRSGLPGSPVGVGFTPAGPMALLAAGEEQWRLLLWDVRRDQKAGVFEGHSDRIHRALFSADGRRVLSAGMDQTARLWSVDGGKPLQCFRGHTGAVLAIDLARDGSKVVTGSEDGSVRLWDAQTGSLVQRFDGQQGAVECVAIDRAGRQVLCGVHDGSLCLWTDLSRPDRFQRLRGHTELVGGVTFLPDGRRALSASADHSVRLWALPE